MLTHQQRIAIAAREIRLRRVDPLLWARAVALAEVKAISSELAYTCLRCRQIDKLKPNHTAHDGADFDCSQVVKTLRERERGWLWDAMLLVASVNCAGVFCLHMWGAI